MVLLAADKLPTGLQEAIQANDLAAIDHNLAELQDVSQAALNACLALAMLNASLETIELLLERGAQLSDMARRDLFARGDPEVFQLLIASGWDINSTEFGRTAVHLALGNISLLTWLLEHGADPNTMSRRLPGSCLRRSTPLASAAQLSDVTLMNTLLAHGADMDPEAIFFAIGFGRQFNGTATLQVLIDHGADVNHVSEQWYTPLIHAVWYQKDEDLKVLLANGADPTIGGSKGGGSALDIAKSRGRMDFFTLMEMAGIRDTP